jgi:ferrous iron transport protein B
VGKSALFQALTDSRVTISNYPGTTITLSRGRMNGHGSMLFDTPGIYGLLPITEDELITRDALLASGSAPLILVLDAKNLLRGLALVLEVAETGRPFIIALNMEDEARNLGIQIDCKALSERLGVPVVPTVAIWRQGVEELIRSVSSAKRSHGILDYPRPLAAALEAIEGRLPEYIPERRFLAISLLCGDDDVSGAFRMDLSKEERALVAEVRQTAITQLDMPLRAAFMRHRLAKAESLLGEVLTRKTQASGARWADRLGEWATHPLWGALILVGVLYALYKFVGEFGAGVLVDFLETRLFGEIVNPFLARWVSSLFPFPLAQDLLVGQYGLLTMGMTYALAIILPLVGTFFLAFAILEDSGYLPRLSLLANRFFRVMGLNGKAVLPMVLGLGCDTMATLTARILETRKERILVTLLLALGVPCSAQLGVILGMLGGSSGAFVLVWVGVIAGVLFVVGFVAARLLPGEPSDFLVELPPMRLPQLSNVLVKTLARIEWFLREAVPIFLLGTLVLFLLDRYGFLANLQVLAAPLVENFLGLPREATGPFLVGFLRRDYGAAGLFALAKAGALNPSQVLVSMVTITLFIPCVANLLIIVKERGLRLAIGMAAFIFPFAFLVGGTLRWVLILIG